MIDYSYGFVYYTANFYKNNIIFAINVGQLGLNDETF